MATCWKVLEEKSSWHGKGSHSVIPDLKYSSVAQLLAGPWRRSRAGVPAEVFLRLEVGSSAAVQRSSDVSHFRVGKVNWFQRP